jgi:hypothetical protein
MRSTINFVHETKRELTSHRKNREMNELINVSFIICLFLFYFRRLDCYPEAIITITLQRHNQDEFIASIG